MGEVIISIDQRLHFRDVTMPFSVIVYELRRDPVQARTFIRAGLKTSPNESRTTVFAERFLRALAKATGEKLGFSELCARAELARSAYSRSVLDGLVTRSKVRRSGEGNNTVYWIES